MSGNSVLDVDEREHFRVMMRMCEKSTGCRVFYYRLISSQFHGLLKVLPMAKEGASDQELIQRQGVFYSEAQVAELALTTKNTAELLVSKDNETVLKVLGMAKMLHCRLRYFTDGAVIGSQEFVTEAFANARERFGAKRKDGTRRLWGSGRSLVKCAEFAVWARVILLDGRAVPPGSSCGTVFTWRFPQEFLQTRARRAL